MLKIRSDYVKPSVFSKIHLAMQYANALVVEISLQTGARVGDVVALPRSALVGRTIIYTAAKTGKVDKKVISCDLCRRLLLHCSDTWLFPSARSKTGHRTRQAVWFDIKRSCKAVGVNANVTPHSARKIYAVSDYHANGLEAVQRDLQHDNINTTLVYALSDSLSNERSINYDTLADTIADKVAQRLSLKM